MVVMSYSPQEPDDEYFIHQHDIDLDEDVQGETEGVQYTMEDDLMDPGGIQCGYNVCCDP